MMMDPINETNGPFPNQIHANFNGPIEFLMGTLEFFFFGGGGGGGGRGRD